MLRCPSCLLIFADHRSACPKHGALEAVTGVTLRAQLDQDLAPSPREVVTLLRSLLQLNSDARERLSPSRVIVAPSRALVGLDNEPEPDPMDEALYGLPDSQDHSPEARATHRFAALAWEMLCAQAPYTGKNPRAVEIKKRLQPPPALSKVRPELSSFFCEALARALCRPDREGRAIEADELVTSLEVALRPLGPPRAPGAFRSPASFAPQGGARSPSPPRSAAGSGAIPRQLPLPSQDLSEFTPSSSYGSVPLAPFERNVPEGRSPAKSSNLHVFFLFLVLLALPLVTFILTKPWPLELSPSPWLWVSLALLAGAVLALIHRRRARGPRPEDLPVDVGTTPAPSAPGFAPRAPESGFEATMPAAALAETLRNPMGPVATVPTTARGPITLAPGGFEPFVVGSYECFEHLGEGAMGVVYKARHVKLQRLCALKVLMPDLARRAEAVRQFHDEARLAASVQHPNTVLIYDFGEIEGTLLYLVMELLEGPSLAELARGALPEVPEALELTRQLCDGLQALHDAGIVHRDLKPQNVMVVPKRSGERVVKIVDFGLARALRELPGGLHDSPRQVSGTPMYMSPEQARGELSPGVSADLFSLSVLVFEWLAGSVPFVLEGRTVVELLYERAQGRYEIIPLRSLRPGLTASASLEALFADGLAPEASRRPRSALEFYQRMRSAVTDLL